MALQFNVVEQPNSQTKEKKWHALSKLMGKRTLKDLSWDLAEVSSLSEGDVQNVIANLFEQLPRWMMNGDSVKPDGFGIFLLLFPSEGVAAKTNLRQATSPISTFCLPPM